ncbi:hypothetical protein [Phascolarctobacterium sp.]|uniref:hypothetical protein n=1 Tax=Phascolarctobacterium sp. TaxID=2049039 RepID=UPI003AB31F9B
MKKVLSVALASAMVLGMGANAFAISYSTGSNDKADWPSNFKFDGELFVTNKDGDIVEEASTALNDSESVNFEPGDVIWMPLYADNQLSYDADWGEGKDEVEAINTIELADSQFTKEADEKLDVKKNGDTIWVLVNSNWEEYKKEDYKGYTMSGFDKEGNATLTKKGAVNGVTVPGTLIFDNVERTVVKNSAKFYINGKQYKTVESFEEALAKADYTIDEVKVTVNLEKIKGEDEWVGKPSVDSQNGVRAYGHYTGNIDKNWSINLIEASTGVAELIEKAELYKATATDYASYSKYTDEIMPKAVYLKVTLKKEWKTASSETMKYYVYVAKNNGSTKDKTNEVWVSGKYENTAFEYVNFDWTNNANEAKLWKVRKGENGTAVFDFADKAFFTVKMYSGESMYLDLSTAYDKTVAGEMDVEADSFYKFDNDNANFSRSGELVIVSDDDSLVPYSIEDGELVKVDAEYVKDYAIAHTNTKVNGFVFSTKQLGNYVLATEEIAEEVEEPADEEKPAEEVKPETKPNPETGAEDFVGLAVSLAVVSVAAAGALALKK